MCLKIHSDIKSDSLPQFDDVEFELTVGNDIYKLRDGKLDDDKPAYYVVTSKDNRVIMKRKIETIPAIQAISVKPKHVDLLHYEENVKNLFSKKYLDVAGLLETFYKTLRDDCYAFSRDIHYTLCKVIYQSSGTGKTRLIRELANVADVLVIYVCLRPIDSSGFPPRSIVADRLLQKFEQQNAADHTSLGCRINYLAFFLACLEIIKINNDNDKQPFNSALTFEPQNSQWNEIVEKWDEHIAKLSHEFNSETITLPTFEARMREKLFAVMKEGYPKEKMLVFAFDEARNLIRANHEYQFFELRRALRCFPDSNDLDLANLDKKMCNVMGVFLDTSSKITNFIPQYQSEPDPSARSAEDGISVFKPFLMHGYWDLEKVKVPQELKDTFIIDNICRLGRPLWLALRDSVTKEPNLNSLITFAQTKLCCNSLTSHQREKKEKKPIELGLLSQLVAFEIVPLSIVAHDLVASLMATCVNINESKPCTIDIVTPSEPCLTVAASYCVFVQKKFSIVLEEFVDFLKNGWVPGGPRGEIVAQLLYVASWNNFEAALSQSYHNCVKFQSVREFLRRLFGRGKLDDIVEYYGSTNSTFKQFARLMNGRVCCSRFVKVSSIVRRDDLHNIFLSGCGIALKEYCPHFDLLIPILLPTESEVEELDKEENLHFDPTQPLNFSCIGIQIKNFQSCTDYDSAEIMSLSLKQTGIFSTLEDELATPSIVIRNQLCQDAKPPNAETFELYSRFAPNYSKLSQTAKKAFRMADTVEKIDQVNLGVKKPCLEANTHYKRFLKQNTFRIAVSTYGMGIFDRFSNSHFFGNCLTQLETILKGGNQTEQIESIPYFYSSTRRSFRPCNKCNEGGHYEQYCPDWK